MRGRITAIIILISIALLIYSTVEGIQIGDFKILSVSELLEKNKYANEKIGEASDLTSQTYPENVEELESSYQQYLIQKQKYEQISLNADESEKESYETKQYDIVYLWRILGKYATEEKFDGDPGLTLDLNVKKTKNENSIYDLDLVVSGTYTRISQFIVDIENDSDIYFRIYNFKMTGDEQTVTGTFTIKNVNIDPSTIS